MSMTVRSSSLFTAVTFLAVAAGCSAAPQDAEQKSTSTEQALPVGGIPLCSEACCWVGGAWDASDSSTATESEKFEWGLEYTFRCDTPRVVSGKTGSFEFVSRCPDSTALRSFVSQYAAVRPVYSKIFTAYPNNCVETLLSNTVNVEFDPNCTGCLKL